MIRTAYKPGRAPKVVARSKQGTASLEWLSGLPDKLNHRRAAIALMVKYGISGLLKGEPLADETYDWKVTGTDDQD